jgi:hypothetical protein
MKRARLIKIGCLFLLFIGFAGWTMDASGQEKKSYEQSIEEYMPLCKGTHWQQAKSDTKVAFIWGAAHVILIENILMKEVPELQRENFSAKVAESRQTRIKSGSTMTINEVVQMIDQFYKDHPDQLEKPVMRVLWDIGIKPNLKTGFAGRPLK